MIDGKGLSPTGQVMDFESDAREGGASSLREHARARPSRHTFGTIPSQTRAPFLVTIASGRRPGEPNYRTKGQERGRGLRAGARTL